VFFPGVRRRYVRLPHAFTPAALALTAVSIGLAAWVLLTTSPTGNGELPAETLQLASVESIAYILPSGDFDDLVVQPASPGKAGVVVASFPYDGFSTFHARGAASPLGSSVATLWLPRGSAKAQLAITELSTRHTRQIEGSFDYFSPIAWDSRATRFAAVSTVETPNGRETTVFEVEVASGRATAVAQFSAAFDVAPVGYSFDGTSLLIVLVDQRGSTLLAERAGKIELVSEVSPGRTRDWSLSPDGARLAFVDILGAGSRTFVGRTLTLATGATTTLPAERNQVGVRWAPGSPVPTFGGPGGSLELSDPTQEAAYIVPGGWAPDGGSLVATVYSEGSDKRARPATAIELITLARANAPSTRVSISTAPGASFLGWVTNLN